MWEKTDAFFDLVEQVIDNKKHWLNMRALFFCTISVAFVCKKDNQKHNSYVFFYKLFLLHHTFNLFDSISALPSKVPQFLRNFRKGSAPKTPRNLRPPRVVFFFEGTRTKVGNSLY